MAPITDKLFVKNFLFPLYQRKPGKILIELDGARGYGSSFLEEAFGGLIRAGFTANEVLDRLDLKSEDNTLIEEIKGYILEQSQPPLQR